MIAKEEILARFSKVYRSGDDQYQCLCPSHKDRTASLGIKFDNDKIVMNCFAGCSLEGILKAVNLSWNDIMPNALDTEYKPNRKFNPYAVMKATRDELLFTALCANAVSHGMKLEASDKDKLFEITGRLRELYDYTK